MDSIKKDLFGLFQIDKMPAEKGVEMLDRLASLVFQAVLVRVLPLLKEEDLAVYEKIVSSPESGGDILYNFLSGKVPEFNKIVEEEAEALRSELASKMGESEVEK